MAPKSLLRHKDAVSPMDDLAGGGFHEVLPDPDPPAKETRRVVFCSGKVYYDLLARRGQEAVNDVACIRIEQLYPFPEQRLREAVGPHAAAEEIVWLQEEPENRGAWSFIFPRLLRMFPDKTIRYAGRAPSASAATGSFPVHRSEQERIVNEALNGGYQTSVGVSSGSFDKGED
jgi:2-oxoglutarate dehydrogenase E1 component